MPLTVDDAQLLRMAAEPPRDAARMLRRSRTFTPLLLLMAVVLPILAATNAKFERETAIWGLKALAVTRAESLNEVIVPGLPWRHDATLYQPPLQAWLTSWLFPTTAQGGIACLFVIPALSLILAAWFGSVWARMSAGSPYGLMFAAILATHAQWLILAATGSSEALTMWLLTATGWAIWRHWETARSQVSLPLLAAGIAWGLALLSGGVLAVAFIGVVSVWALILRPRETVESTEIDAVSSNRRRWTVAIVFATGAAVGGWWIAYMIEQFGLDFVRVWLTHGEGLNQAISRSDRVLWRNEMIHWLERTAFLSGFLILGVTAGLRSFFIRDQSPAQHFAGFMTCWFLVGATLRLAPGLMLETWGLDASRPWESFCTIPAAYLAAHGLLEMTQRRVSTRWVLTCLTITVGCITAALSHRWQVGLIVGGTVGIVLAASAPLAVGLRRTSLAWSEGEIRRWIQGFGMLALLGHVATGSHVWWTAPNGRNTYESSRSTLIRLKPPDQISLVTSEDDEDPAQLEFLLRSLFPKAKWSHSIGWDPELTNTIVAEVDKPQSRMLIVEWSRKELKVGGDVGTGWQVSPILDAVPYRGRRFAAIMIEPERMQTADRR